MVFTLFIFVIITFQYFKEFEAFSSFRRCLNTIMALAIADSVKDMIDLVSEKTFGPLIIVLVVVIFYMIFWQITTAILSAGFQKAKMEMNQIKKDRKEALNSIRDEIMGNESSKDYKDAIYYHLMYEYVKLCQQRYGPASRKGSLRRIILEGDNSYEQSVGSRRFLGSIDNNEQEAIGDIGKELLSDYQGEKLEIATRVKSFQISILLILTELIYFQKFVEKFLHIISLFDPEHVQSNDRQAVSQFLEEYLIMLREINLKVGKIKNSIKVKCS